MPSGELNAQKTQCIRCHAFDQANTGHKNDGARYCRACRKLYKYPARSDNVCSCGVFTGRSTRCRECNRDSYLKREFGISKADYELILARQAGVCAICEKPESEGRSLAVDHDHATGVIRGLLCRKCNTAIGQLGDSADALRRALAYLEGA